MLVRNSIVVEVRYELVEVTGNIEVDVVVVVVGGTEYITGQSHCLLTVKYFAQLPFVPAGEHGPLSHAVCCTFVVGLLGSGPVTSACAKM